MAYSTRSQRSTGASTPSDSGDMSQPDLENMRQNLDERDKYLQRRQQEIDDREENLVKEKEAAVSIESLTLILTDIRRSLSALDHVPGEIDILKRQVFILRNQAREAFSPIEDTAAKIDKYVNNTNQNAKDINHGPRNSFHSPPVHSKDDFNASPIRFKDVVDSIPRYDGHRMSVFQFSKICERALSLINPQQETYLVQLIVNKLEGHAYSVIEGTEFQTVSDITRQLKRIFGPNKSLNQCRGELGNIYMYPNEDIFSYVDRIKELHTAIVDATIDTNGSIDTWTKGSIEYDVLEGFINGLPSELLIRVKLQGQCNTLDRAIVSAIQLSKTLEAELRRKKPAYVPRPNPSPRIDYTPKNNNPDHDDSRMHTDNPSSFQQPKSTNVPFTKASPFAKPFIPGQRRFDYIDKMCVYCKTPGHLIQECRKLAYRRNIQNMPGPSGYMPRNNESYNSGNMPSVTGNDGVPRNADSQGRPILAKTVRFDEEKLPTIPE